MSASGCKINQVFRQVFLSMKLMQKKFKKKTREEKEVGAISSVPQKSYRNEYDRTQLSRAISTGDWRKSKTGSHTEMKKSQPIFAG